ncbi:MAG: replicative DNA helicase [Candidatus Magasanikbacteria bacterium]|nr:replicative DNA helicase [Candidatus Magasanikbacteria bacterium]
MIKQTELGRIPPQNLDAEKSLIGSILVDPNAMLKIADMIEADDFYKRAHAKIFESISELYSKNEPVDLLVLSNKLEEKGILENIGGKSYLAQLSNSVPTSSHAKHYAEIIKRKATLRKLSEVSEKISDLVFGEETDDVEAVLDNAQQLMYGVTEKHLKQNFSPIRSILSDTFERIDELHRDKGKMRGVPTGFTDLDKLLAGLQKSDLIILAARPSVGKTSFALDIARNAAVQAKVGVGLFSLEMSKEQLVDRMLCAQANINLWKMRNGSLSDSPDSDDFKKIGSAMGVLSEAPIFIDDSAGANITQIRTKARRLKTEHDIGLIVIDYLQLMSSAGRRSDNRVQEVADMSRGLKLLARELNIPLLVLSQLSRAAEQTKPAIPKLSHLRDSGSIEQDADVVIFLYRKATDRNYRPEDITPQERSIAEVHIAKHRNGPVGMIKTFFDETQASFKNLDTRFQTTEPPQQHQGSAPVPEAPPF